MVDVFSMTYSSFSGYCIPPESVKKTPQIQANHHEVLNETPVKKKDLFAKRFLLVCFFYKKQYIITLPETNIAPKNGWLEY